MSQQNQADRREQKHKYFGFFFFFSLFTVYRYHLPYSTYCSVQANILCSNWIWTRLSCYGGVSERMSIYNQICLEVFPSLCPQCYRIYFFTVWLEWKNEICVGVSKYWKSFYPIKTFIHNTCILVLTKSLDDLFFEIFDAFSELTVCLLNVKEKD